MKNFRSCLYHESHPTGLVFTDEGEYNEALGMGWVQAPWLVGEVKEDAIKEGEKSKSDIIEHQGDGSGRTPAKTSGGSVVKQRKKPGRKSKNG